MTVIDMDTYANMSEVSKGFVHHFITEHRLGEHVLRMEDTPDGLKVDYLATDDDGRPLTRGDDLVVRTRIVEGLKLPWSDL